MNNDLETLRHALMRMDESEIQDRLQNNQFTSEAREIAKEVLLLKKNAPQEKKGDEDDVLMSPRTRRLVAFGVIGLVGALVLGLRKFARQGNSRR